jgi:hypothetical protein
MRHVLQMAAVMPEFDQSSGIMPAPLRARSCSLIRPEQESFGHGAIADQQLQGVNRHCDLLYDAVLQKVATGLTVGFSQNT